MIFPGLKDESWTIGRGPLTFQIGLSTFGILALELALIRWTSGQIRIFAYFNNLVLIGAFMGMGLGIALGRRRPGLIHYALPMLFILSIPLAFSENLDIMRISFPDHSVFLWGGEKLTGSAVKLLGNLSIFIFIFILIMIVFIFAGSAVGHLFPKIPTLRAYSSDLAGSLLGIIVFTIATFFNASPPVWLCIGALPFLWLSRRIFSAAAFIGVIVLGFISIKGAIYSPYNRIDIKTEEAAIKLEVNRDFHQFMYDLSDRALANPKLSEKESRRLKYLREVYDIPFLANKVRGSALIVGAGTGNDAQAAVRCGFEKVYSVDIDGEIIDLGKKFHPEKPYSNPKVIPVVNDARAFFEQYNGPPFDVICYGLVDSHAMFSSMSTLRLDNYVYTEEGIGAAWKHVSEAGHLSISFSVFAGNWIFERLYWMIARATGKQPLAIYHGMHYGVTFLVAPNMNNLVADSVKQYKRLTPEHDEMFVDIPSDNWPFLYVRPATIPWGYIAVIFAILIIASISAPLAFGIDSLKSDFDPILFFMGAAFMLIETRGVTSLSLLFGSTWIVNSAIFSGVLIMVLTSNLLVERFNLKNAMPWFIFLLLSTTLLWAFNFSMLNKFSMLNRGLLGGSINALPIGFAGIIVSILLSRSPKPASSLGSNLLGSVVGGCFEYFSMQLGLKALVLMAMIFYLIALLMFRRREQKKG